MENKPKLMNKKEIAYTHIRSLIVNGTYGSGQRIIIDQIAKELGLSHIPVREAIRQLEADGMIQFKPYSGAVVTSIDEEEYTHILTMIGVLEGYAAGLSSLQLQDNDYEQLIYLNKKMEVAFNSFDFEEFGELNRLFHAFIVEKCGNPILIEAIKDAQNRMDRVRMSVFTIVPKRAARSIQEHSEIITLLKEKASFETIEAAVRKHKMNTIAYFKQRKKHP